MSKVYGNCPECGKPGVSRERRPNGNDVCENGHIYPSKTAILKAEPNLIPVDTERCQTIVQEYNPFRIGGPCHTAVQCLNKAVFVVTETTPNENGETGAMSLCAKCLLIFQEQIPNHATAYVKQTVEDWKSDQEKGLVKAG